LGRFRRRGGRLVLSRNQRGAKRRRDAEPQTKRQPKGPRRAAPLIAHRQTRHGLVDDPQLSTTRGLLIREPTMNPG